MKTPRSRKPRRAVHHRAQESGKPGAFHRRVAETIRIREFHHLFSARKHSRQFTLFLGPTNSGKTYQALRRLSQAESGVYLAPLRLLALEVADTLNQWGVPCNMVTGEERIAVEGAAHTASTIEMLSLEKAHNVCVIDEIQMLGDSQRGWAWTQAILGAPAREVCLVGAPEARPVIEKLLRLTGEPYEVVKLDRLVPLRLKAQPVKRILDLEPGTAIVAFSRAAVLGLKQELEQQTGKQTAVLYGALPPEVRRQQAVLFASGHSPWLVATDAIGMGLNLPIRTLLFAQDSKFINRRETPLTPLEVRQISGRAGRFGLNEIGFVGTYRIPTAPIQAALRAEPEPVERAHLAPNLDQLLAIAGLKGDQNDALAKLLQLFVRSVKPDPTIYLLANLTDQIVLARITDRFQNLDLSVRFALSAAPVALRSRDTLMAFEQMTATVARGEQMPLSRVLPNGHPDLPRLNILEETMRVVNLYCWLHYRFADCFPELEQAIQHRKKINKEISTILQKKRPTGLRGPRPKRRTRKRRFP